MQYVYQVLSRPHETDLNSPNVWTEVEDALEAIIDEYERVNHIISLYQDDKLRINGLMKVGPQDGVGLELGPGPGNFTEMLINFIRGPLICLDYSDKMLSVARSRNICAGFIRGIFEVLPFRKEVLSYVSAAYALRDSTDKKRSLEEIKRTLRNGGKLLIIDIGKPNNSVIRCFFSLYMRFIVPIIGGLATHNGYRNPWRLLYKTYELLPMNRELERMMRSTLGYSELEERVFGGLMVATAEKI